MNHVRLKGLIAAVLTPISPTSGDLDLSVIPAYAEYLLRAGVTGFYCCGSTGEGVSLTTNERKQVVEAWVKATAGRATLIVQVGHNASRDAADLASHAQSVGADAVSATCPSYFKIDSVSGLVECMAEIAEAAPKLPFYYYHIPSLTGSRLSMPEFLSAAGPRIPNLAGMKYTSPELFEFMDCLNVEGGKFEVVWGVDEMLLGALAMGATAAIGSTYNVAAPLYNNLIQAFESQELEVARSNQMKSIEFIRVLKRYPFFAALKYVASKQGFQLGKCRTPNGNLTVEQTAALDRQWSELSL